MKKTALFFTALTLLATPAMAERDVRAELKEKQAQHEELVKKSKAIGSEVENLKSKLVKSSQSIRLTEKSLSETEIRLKSLEEKRAIYIEQFYKDQEALGGVASAAQRFKRTSTSQLLLQSKPIDAARASIVMKRTIPALQDHSDAVRAQLAQIEEVEEKISGQKALKEKELKKISDQQKDLSGLLEKRQEIYEQTENERKEQEAEVKKLAAEAKNLDDLLLKIKNKRKKTPATASAPVSRDLPAGMILPVSGTVKTAFGEQTELEGRSKGITFSVRPGATVSTPLSGVVKFAGPFQKYRQILIVEHQGGYHSLIAGLGKIDTVVGASLSAGEPVGRASSEGTPQIYYELRQNGDPVNPQKRLAQRKQGKT